jgi:hypothetical protein
MLDLDFDPKNFEKLFWLCQEALRICWLLLRNVDRNLRFFLDEV